MARGTEEPLPSAKDRPRGGAPSRVLRTLLTGDMLAFTERIPLPEPLRRSLLSIDLLLSRRPGMFVAAGAFMLLVALLTALTGDGEARSAWSLVVVTPMLLLGAPILADVIALERRSGSLDLALSSPGARHVFERRLLAGLAVLLGQAWLVIAGMWYGFSLTFALVPPLVQALLLCALLGSATLFWAVRLRTPGAVLLATVATIAVLGKWSLRPPIPDPALPGLLVPPWRESADWAVASLVLAGASLLLYLHARRRLDRPETLLR